MDEGLSLTELADRANIPLSTVSRITSMLAMKNGRKAYGLVTVNIAPQERRRKQIYLSDKGKKTIKNLSQAIYEIKEQKEFPSKIASA